MTDAIEAVSRAIVEDADTPPFADPHEGFERWLRAAEATGMVDANAMSVATVDADGQPSVRTVLLKAYDERGFVFYTNGQSRKGQALRANPRCALLFFWRDLGRQIRIRGPVERVSDAESDAYFASRGLTSRLGAWASAQSEPLSDRAALARRFSEMARRFSDGEPERPPHWGGYRVVPEAIEFWEARASRLHVRWEYRRNERGWTPVQLNP